ncbi:uncharacterized protein LOC119333502 [Triticum dicoccoides]|uniref:uncharacterized protein LOC119333502 n=1 Tax=Triticum dicoccoides TaxID=85692 RepID=UPI00188ECA09|nr:uncharacterized protein LOC119333502 [Triticum dicoccoides]
MSSSSHPTCREDGHWTALLLLGTKQPCSFLLLLWLQNLGGEIRIVIKVTNMKEIKRCMEKDVNGVTKVAKLTGIKMTTLEERAPCTIEPVWIICSSKCRTAAACRAWSLLGKIQCTLAFASP